MSKGVKITILGALIIITSLYSIEERLINR
jgi:hypothetical protein